MNKKVWRGRGCAAVTLIELLVVIALIGIIAAMVLPRLDQTKQRSRAIRCLSNLKQMDTGWMLYYGDNSDKLVFSGGVNCLVQNPNDPNAREGGSRSQWVLGSMHAAPSWTNSALVQRGLLWPYLRVLDLYKCPDDPKTDKWTANGGAPTLRSMSMNCWLNPLVPWPGGRVFRKQSDLILPPPSRCWVMVDECPNSIEDGCFVCAPNSDKWVDIPAGYHGSGSVGSLSFADGHVELKKWTDKNLPLALYGNSPSDPASRDLSWLKERSTIRR